MFIFRLSYIYIYICILLGIGGQNDKGHLKIFKLFRIIPKKKI